MNMGTCKTENGNEGDETHDDRSQGFFEDAFSSCLYEINASAHSPDISLGFSKIPFLIFNDPSHQLTIATEAGPIRPNSAENETLAPLEWIRSLPSLPPGSSSNSSIQHQRHISSNSSGSGLLASDIMMVDESQITAWNTDEGFLSNNLGPFARRGPLASQNQSGGEGDVVYQRASAAYATPHKSRVTSPNTTLNLPVSPLFQSSLGIERILEKSRVETQIPVTLKMQHLPEGIKRIHFPPSSISKSKLLTRPPPTKSPDMLEVHVALVCTSAMSDSTKRKRALDREAARKQQIEGACNLGENQKPLDGGEVNSCSKCIKRERKRASRKKIKNIDEEEAWQRLEANRIIVFNTQEVIELPDLATTHSTTQSVETGNIPGPHHRAFATAPASVDISLAMRITCYCRHHEEKVGFRYA